MNTNQRPCGNCCAHKNARLLNGMNIRFKDEVQSVSPKESDLLMAVLANLLATIEAVENDAAKIE